MTEAKADMVMPERYHRALTVKRAKRVRDFPDLKGWSKDPRYQLKEFQKKDVVYMFFARRCLNLNQVGLGKKIEALALMQLLKERGELGRALVITIKPDLPQWVDEAHLFTNLRIMGAQLPKRERMALYANPNWEVLVVSYPLIHRDWEILQQLGCSIVICDEASVFRHHDTWTNFRVGEITRSAERIVPMDATPIQTSLMDMHALMEVIHMTIFGSPEAFNRYFINRRRVKVKRGNSFKHETQIVSYKNMDEFKGRIDPFYIRHRAKDSDVAEELPEVTPSTQWFELGTSQKRFYDQARAGLIDMMQNVGDRNRMIRVRGHFHHLQYACDTTHAFGEDPPESVKLDWIMEALAGDLADEKVIIFSRYKTVIEDAVARFARAGIRYAVYSGDITDEDERRRAIAGFRTGNTQVLIGTVSLERALNLQVSAFLIMINQLYNPARIEQIVGRLKRIGSLHARISLINLLTRDTVEERMFHLLPERQAVSDFVFDEASDIFDQLSDAELAALIQA